MYSNKLLILKALFLFHSLRTIHTKLILNAKSTTDRLMLFIFLSNGSQIALIFRRELKPHALCAAN